MAQYTRPGVILGEPGGVGDLPRRDANGPFAAKNEDVFDLLVAYVRAVEWIHARDGDWSESTLTQYRPRVVDQVKDGLGPGSSGPKVAR